MASSPLSNPSAAGAGSGSDTGIPSHVAAGLCALVPLASGAIFYFIEKKDPLVRHWAVESILFGGAWIAFHVLTTILFTLFGPIPGLHLILVPLLGLAWFVLHLAFIVLWLIGMIQAFQGRRWAYPYISAQGRRLFPQLVP